MNILIALLPVCALTASAQSFQYLNFAQIQAQQASVPEPAGAPAAPADPIESIDRSAWQAMTLDQWRACDSWRQKALQDPQNIRTSEIKDTDGNIWTRVDLRWTSAGTNPPVTGWDKSLCAAGRLIVEGSYEPLARFKLSSDRKELILWTGPSASHGYAPTDMFYWRLRADEILSAAAKADPRIRLPNSAWLWAEVLQTAPMVFFDTFDKKSFQPSILPAILQLIDSEGLLGPASPYADPQVRAAVAARAAEVMKLGGPDTYAQFDRDSVFIKNDTDDAERRLNAPISDFLPEKK